MIPFRGYQARKAGMTVGPVKTPKRPIDSRSQTLDIAPEAFARVLAYLHVYWGHIGAQDIAQLLGVHIYDPFCR
ncbi:hypothetical protein VTN77DRAFT_4603 [Rasamsonia byssochlamydoides]|uniref:uncharacterized protein n=1 Tax=Rasamsonia byssochlamydoides TaxID=89139 RepID=UPI003744046B